MWFRKPDPFQQNIQREDRRIASEIQDEVAGDTAFSANLIQIEIFLIRTDKGR
jgi:hypothetical protein